ncbi:hypothetical protein Ancab_027822 [Ancistrocladus abbreviatus]
MHGGEKLAFRDCGNSSSSKTGFGSNRNTSLQIKDGKLVNLSKKIKSISQNHKMVSSSRLLRQMDADSCQKKRKGNFPRKQLINNGLPNEPLRKQSCKLQGIQSFLESFKDTEGHSIVYNTQKLKTSSRHKRKKDKVVLDEAARLQRRARYLLVKMKLEQNLIDAYSGEGWKGQSREKIRPEKELQRANKQILKCKLGLRDVVHQLDTLSSVGQIEESVIAPDGSVHHDHIYCAKCKLKEASEDNDIILCDGSCNCAFHQKCLDPPLATENIPPGDQGWLCKYCECKMEILEAMNAHLGTQFSATDSWKDIFKEEALWPEGGASVLNPEEEWPDDDSEDNDYDPSDENNSCGVSLEGYASDVNSASSSLSCSLVSEAHSESGWSSEQKRPFDNNSPMGQIAFQDSDENDGHEIISGPRRRYAVDYKKLYDEMFGKDTANGEQLSEDEDWGPPRKRQRENESDAANTLMTLCEREKNHLNLQIVQVESKLLPNSRQSKSFSRMPVNAVEKLRQVFAENELPCRAVKRNISEQLGLEFEKVNKWFKNARYLALKARKAERVKGLQCSPSKISNKSNTEDLRNKVAQSVKVKHLSRVSWRANLKSLLSPLKKQQHRRTSLCPTLLGTKGPMEMNDNMSLKKQLLHLKAKNRQKKNLSFSTACEAQAEMQMDQICQIDAKIQKLKHMLCKYQTADEPNFIYIPVAELKEKI